MDFTITIPDTVVPRIVMALGLSGTAAQKKTQAEAWLKGKIKTAVNDYENTQDAIAASHARAAEIATW